jgi:hypothetical protein
MVSSRGKAGALSIMTDYQFEVAHAAILRKDLSKVQISVEYDTDIRGLSYSANSVFNYFNFLLRLTFNVSLLSETPFPAQLKMSLFMVLK